MSDKDLTVAYIAIGADAALREVETGNDRSLQRLLAEYSGQLGVVDEAIKHAGLLDNLADAMNEHLTGVFAYEIAEPFGMLYVRAMLARAETSDDAPISAATIALDLLKDAIK